MEPCLMTQDEQGVAPSLVDQDLPQAAGSERKYPVKKALVLWDYENCPVPRGVSADSVVRNIHSVARMYGFQPLRTHVYNPVSNAAVRERIVDAGGTAIDARKKGRKECADRAMIEDMWSWAYDCHAAESTGFVVITADSDFGNVITNLVNRGFSFLVITKSGAREHLHKQADFMAHWHTVLQGVGSLGFAMGPDTAAATTAHGEMDAAALRASAESDINSDDEDLESIINAGSSIEREDVLSVIGALADPVTGDTYLAAVGLYVQRKFPAMFQQGLVGQCARELEALGLIVRTGPGKVALAGPGRGRPSAVPEPEAAEADHGLTSAMGSLSIGWGPVTAEEMMKELIRQQDGDTQPHSFHLGQVGNDLRSRYGRDRVPKGRVRQLVDELSAAGKVQEIPARTHIFLDNAVLAALHSSSDAAAAVETDLDSLF
mmetsp:Transcript_14070/g.55411  ORF Transcript_14070/g.55411 Transcript_14070/m.55411 type:complete len:433 (+) Transcript_14070:277-1575(+)